MTAKRRTLVIASHWDIREKKEEDRLVRLEPYAHELTELLLDPKRGSYAPAHGDGLLLNPRTVSEVTDAVEEAFREAQAARASLLLGFLGHGFHPQGGDFFFPISSTPAAPGPETAFDLPGEVGRMTKRYGGVPELTLVVDGCFSGHALLAAAEGWLRSAMQAGRTVEVLTSSDDRVSYDLQFSRVLTRIVRHGDIRLEPFLETKAVRLRVQTLLRRQIPQAVAFDGGTGSRQAPSEAWIARNVAHDHKLSVLAGSPDQQVLVPALRHFQPPAELARIARVVRLNRLVAVVGAMGTGKTTIATALARPELLPEDETDTAATVCAVVRLSDAAWTSGTAVQQLARQLRRYLPGFDTARTAYRARVPLAQRTLLPSTVAEVAGPLVLMEAREPVRVVVDGLDQVKDPTSRAALFTELAALRDAAPEWFGVVATVQEWVALPEDWHQLPAPVPDDRNVRAYLRARRVPEDAQQVILARRDGNWQLTKVLAHFGPSEASEVGEGLADAYDKALVPLRDQASSHGASAWLDPVLLVVAASGPGMTLPRPLLARAAGELGGPADEEAVCLVLRLLDGLVVRSPDPSGTELLGVYHPSLVEYVAEEQDLVEGHRALCDALEIMAPMEQHTPDGPLHRYAEQAEPEHLWQVALAAPDENAAAALYERLLASLELRAAPEATVNRARWASWAERLGERLGADAPTTLLARARTAYWTSKSGAYGRARELYRELLPDQLRVLDADDPEPLEARSRIAYATGEMGEFAEAVALHREVLADQERLLGPDDPRTLDTRHHIAYWTGRGGAREEGLRLHEELLPDLQRVLSPTDVAVLEERHYIAYWHGMLGRYDRALELHAELLRDRIEAFGEEHEQVVFSRMNICKFLGESGRLQEALHGYGELLPLVTQVRGAYHPNTFLVRLNTARFTWELGNAAGALPLHEEVLRDQREVLGDTHPAAMITRYNIAMLKAELGDPATALAELDVLLEQRLARYANPGHPEVITTRFGRARTLARLGEVESAVALLRKVVADRARVLGDEHRDTREARQELDRLLGD
ncbi:tetratricopeptide repeat-containing protein [Streptomyces gelaticus]|uniref:tetratricopeptide repeat-containing protein n=1 Tax=Streptomyces gelaticus TaxID=285446 RepID=UPI0016796B57|nr:tetratricopeptide repeat-containing protein [Streptomyces gelaticus]